MSHSFSLWYLSLFNFFQQTSQTFQLFQWAVTCLEVHNSQHFLLPLFIYDKIFICMSQPLSVLGPTTYICLSCAYIPCKYVFPSLILLKITCIKNKTQCNCKTEVTEFLFYSRQVFSSIHLGAPGQISGLILRGLWKTIKANKSIFWQYTWTRS